MKGAPKHQTALDAGKESLDGRSAGQQHWFDHTSLKPTWTPGPGARECECGGVEQNRLRLSKQNHQERPPSFPWLALFS